MKIRELVPWMQALQSNIDAGESAFFVLWLHDLERVAITMFLAGLHGAVLKSDLTAR
jgi:hypothetical protein